MTRTRPDTKRQWPRLADMPYILLLITVMSWSGNFILGRAVHADVPPVALAFWRWTVGFLLILPFAWPHLRRDFAVVVSHWRIIVVLSAFGIAAFNTLVYLGLHSTTAINALLLQSTMPMMIIVCSFVFFGERITWLQALGLFLSTIGALTVISGGNLAVVLNLSFGEGDLLIVIAVALYAAYSALLRLRPEIHAFSLVAVTFALGAMMLAPFYVVEMRMGIMLTLDGPTLASIAYVGVFPSIVAYLCFNRAVEVIGANRAGMFIHLMPIIGSLMAIGLLGERFDWEHAAGMAAILGGIVMATRIKARR